MNSSSFIDRSVFIQNSTITIVQSWFIPLDIFLIICCSLVIILTTFVLSIMILDKTFHTVPMILIFNCSFLLQALYRYLIVIYPTRLFFQSFRFQILTICSIWIFSFVFIFEFLFDRQIIYNVDNQICQLPLSFSFSMIYMSSCIFFCPVSLIIFIY
jgi:hypothetical protein